MMRFTPRFAVTFASFCAIVTASFTAASTADAQTTGARDEEIRTALVLNFAPCAHRPGQEACKTGNLSAGDPGLRPNSRLLRVAREAG